MYEEFDPNSEEEQTSEEELLTSLVQDPVNNETALLTKIQAIYHQYLKSQFVDFLKDFGRNEQILLDGDALLFFSLSDKLLDWRNGGQFLHAIFIFERILDRMWSLGAQIQVFFLSGNDEIFHILDKSYILCRKVLLRHLQKNESCGRFHLKVHIVQGSWYSNETEDWERLVTEVRPAFIFSSNWCSLHCKVSIMQHWFVHKILISGYYVVVFDGLKIKGSRIKAFLFSPPFPSKASKINQHMSILKPNLLAILSQIDHIPTTNEGHFDPYILSISSLFLSFCDIRFFHYARSLSHLLNISENQDQTKGFAAICCVSIEIMRQLPLTARTFLLPGDNHEDGTKADALSACAISKDLRDATAKFVRDFHSNLALSIDHADDEGLLENLDVSVVNSIADIYDGRLFHMLLLQTMAGYVPPVYILKRAMQLFATICSQPAETIDTIALLGASEADIRAAKNGLEETKRFHRMQISNIRRSVLRRVGDHESLLTEVLGDVRAVMSTFEGSTFEEEENSKNSVQRRFRPHHFHSAKPLQNEPDSFSYDLDLRQYVHQHSGKKQLKFKSEIYRALGRGDQNVYVRYLKNESEKSTMKRKQRKETSKALAEFNYQSSLLVGTSVKQQIITTDLTTGTLHDLRSTAQRALAMLETPVRLWYQLAIKLFRLQKVINYWQQLADRLSLQHWRLINTPGFNKVFSSSGDLDLEETKNFRQKSEISYKEYGQKKLLGF